MAVFPVILIFCTAGVFAADLEKRSSLLCGECKGVPNPRNCRFYQECHHDEVCHAERIGNYYNLKCGSLKHCENIKNHHNRKRLLLTMYMNEDCCLTSFCNARLFQEDFTTTTSTTTTTAPTTTKACEDNPLYDCAKLITEVNICHSSTVGWQHCAKSCNYCATTTPPPPCEDTTGYDCKSLITEVDICHSAHVGRQHCAKSCHFCHSANRAVTLPTSVATITTMTTTAPTPSTTQSSTTTTTAPRPTTTQTTMTTTTSAPSPPTVTPATTAAQTCADKPGLDCQALITEVNICASAHGKGYCTKSCNACTTPTPCLDKAGIDCAALMKDTNICNSQSIGRKYCKHSCNAC